MQEKSVRIPAEILTPYLSEIVGKPSVDNRRAEPVGESADIQGTPLSVDSDRPPVPRPEQPETKDQRREASKKSGGQPHAEERRKENRRKETRPVYLDTRSSQNRRESARATAINFKI
jgi:hypothetical protein